MIGGNMKRTVSYLLFALSLASSAMQLHAQDLVHYKRVVKALSSAKYQGRGYAKGGATIERGGTAMHPQLSEKDIQKCHKAVRKIFE